MAVPFLEKSNQDYQKFENHNDVEKVAKIGVPYFHILNVTSGVYFNTIKVGKILEGCLDLILSPLPSVKIQIMGGKIRKSVVRIPALEGQIKICPFSFHFQILHTKLHIFIVNHF